MSLSNNYKNINVASSSGRLTLVFGPMFSGKTTKLIETYRNLNKCAVVVNYSDDTRYSETELSNHDRIMIPCIKTKKLMDLEINMDFITAVKKYKAILIDEAQFYDDLLEFVFKYLEKLNKDVYVFGLDCDFRREKFGQLLDLVPHTDTLIKLTANCSLCGLEKKAIYTHRITKESETILIGNNNYIPLCRKCYIKSI